MKIGIIVYSQTGHTLSVAEKIRDSLLLQGHEANIEEVRVEGQGEAKEGSNPNPVLIRIPSPACYDAVIFGSPVHGFSLSLPMVKYLSQITGLQGKKVGCFVTQHFKYGWMGGNRSLKQMSTACIALKGEISQSGVVHWNSPERDRQTEELIKKLSIL